MVLIYIDKCCLQSKKNNEYQIKFTVFFKLFIFKEITYHFINISILNNARHLKVIFGLFLEENTNLIFGSKQKFKSNLGLDSFIRPTTSAESNSKFQFLELSMVS